MTMTMKDDCSYNLRTGKWIAGPGKVNLKDIKNPINQYVTASRRIGVSNDEIKIAVADYVRIRGPIGTGKYACSCNSFGPRWIEDSLDGCCPGCFQWALDHHYEVPTSKLDPNRVTREMVEKNTWGISAKQLYKNKAIKHHEMLHSIAAAGNRKADAAGVKEVWLHP